MEPCIRRQQKTANRKQKRLLKPPQVDLLLVENFPDWNSADAF